MKNGRNIALVLAVAAIAGCASPGYKEGDQASGTMRAASAEAATAQAAVTTTLTALNDVMTAKEGDLRPRYEAFSTGVDKLRQSMQDLKHRTEAMSNNAASYLARWDRDLNDVKSADLRAKSRQRRAEVGERVRRVKDMSEQTGTLSATALSDLDDVRRVLGTDLTRGGIASVRDAAARAETSSVALRDSAARLTAELDALSNEVSSMASPPAQPEK